MIRYMALFDEEYIPIVCKVFFGSIYSVKALEAFWKFRDSYGKPFAYGGYCTMREYIAWRWFGVKGEMPSKARKEAAAL